MNLGGYGVELALKNMEYKAIDDSEVKKGANSSPGSFRILPPIFLSTLTLKRHSGTYIQARFYTVEYTKCIQVRQAPYTFGFN